MCVAGSLHNPVLLKLLFSLMETDKIVAQTVLFRTTETVNKLCLGPGMARMERDCNWKKIGPLLFKFYLKYSKNQPGGGGGGGGRGTRPGTEKRCSHNLQSNPLGSGFTKGRENFPQ